MAALKRFTSILSGKRNPFERNRSQHEDESIEGDTPEANIARSVKLFCESGSPDSQVQQGEEVLHLPVIVEAAESSPAAAAVAANQIRKYLSQSNSSRPHVQYNAIMLFRILADNPGQTFTRNVDAKFVSTVKDVLRNCRDPSVQQITREMLMTMYREKAYDTNLGNLFAMWQKESGVGGNSSGGSPAPNVIPGPPPGPPPFGGGRHKGLPEPAELAQRIEEARTSAKLLQQLVQSTPQAELKQNELIKEFAERCQAAQRSTQGYIGAENPAPDDDTMQTLIETSEQLSLALSKHSRALLQARRAQSGGHSPTPPIVRSEEQTHTYNPAAAYVPTSAPAPESTYSPPPMPPPSRKAVPTNNYPEEEHTYSPPPLPPPSHRSGPVEDPFADSHATLAPADLHNRPKIPNVTPSYVRRQDDSEANYTMTGGRDSVPVSPERGSHGRGESIGGGVSPIETKTRRS